MLKLQIGFSTSQSHLQNFDFIEIRKGTDHSQKSQRHIVFGESINHNLCFYLVGITGAKKGKLSKVVWFQGALTSPTYLFSFTPRHRHNMKLIIENVTINGIILPFFFNQLLGGFVTLNGLIASECDSPDLNTLDVLDSTIFHNGPQK